MHYLQVNLLYPLFILHYGLCLCVLVRVDWRELLGDGHRCVRAGQRALAIERLGRRLVECVLALARLAALGVGVDRAALLVWRRIQRQQRAPAPIFRSRSLYHQHVDLFERQCAICGSTCGRGAGPGAGAGAIAAVGSRPAAARAVALDGAAARERVSHQLPAREGHRHAQRRVATAQGPGTRTSYFETIVWLRFTE